MRRVKQCLPARRKGTRRHTLHDRVQDRRHVLPVLVRPSAVKVVLEVLVPADVVVRVQRKVNVERARTPHKALPR